MTEVGDEEDKQIGVHHGKRDLDRVGFFDDPRGPLEDPYELPVQPIRSGIARNKAQMTAGFVAGGYFNNKPSRIFEGECLPELGRRKPKKSSEPKGVIKPPGYTKWHSTPGDAHGCFSKHPKRLDPASIPVVKGGRTRPNPMTRPNPIGGPGYSAITINPYVSARIGPDPYDPHDRIGPDTRVRFYATFYPSYFDKNPHEPAPDNRGGDQDQEKTQKRTGKVFHLHFPRGGPKNGCLSRFPPWISDPIDGVLQSKKAQKKHVVKEIWLPGIVPTTRTKYTSSIVDRVTSLSCNATNFSTYREKVYKIH